MDLVIETLTGTAFELRVSPFETIMSVKAKIQRLEGIPMSQQHLIWRSIELEDDYCLHDYNIQDGTTLKLVLAMRGGPINTRRVSLEDPTLREMAEYMEAYRDDIWDTLMKDNRQVTLLVFRDGDQLNFFRVYDRGDGTLTPMSETLSATSMYNMYEDGEDVAEVSPEREKENSETKAKMDVLREQMAQLSVRRKEKEKENSETKAKVEMLRSEMAKLNLKKKSVLKPRPPSTEKPSSNLAKRRLKFAEKISYQRHRQQKGTLNDSTVEETTTPAPDSAKKTLPPVSLHKMKDDVDISDIMAANNKDSKLIQDISHPLPRPPELSRHDSSLERGDISERLKRRTNSSRNMVRRTHPKGLSNNNTTKDVPLEAVSTGEDDFDGRITNRATESRFRNASSSSKILQDLMLRNSSFDESDVRDFTRNHTEGVSQSPEEVDENRTLGQLLRGSKEYRDYKALISWIRPRSDAKQHSPVRESSRVRFEQDVARNSSGRIMQDIGTLSRSRKTPEDLITSMPLTQKKCTLRRTKSRRESSSYALPPVSGKKRPPQLMSTSKKKTRCTQCAKKLGLATSYQCRCGNVFCASHRYAETHDCTYDYKAEGKKVLEQSNPLVIAPKLPKI